jgi:hypothetical protein
MSVYSVCTVRSVLYSCFSLFFVFSDSVQRAACCFHPFPFPLARALWGRPFHLSCRLKFCVIQRISRNAISHIHTNPHGPRITSEYRRPRRTPPRPARRSTDRQLATRTNMPRTAEYLPIGLGLGPLMGPIRPTPYGYCEYILIIFPFETQAQFKKALCCST